MLIAQGSTVTISFLATDTTFPHGVTGANPWTVSLAVNGAAVPGLIAATLPNLFGGWYAFTVGPPTTNTLGQLIFQATATDPNNPGETAFASGTDLQIVPASVISPGAGGPIAIERNVAIAAFPFPMYTPMPTQTLLTGLAVSGQRSLDGGAFVAIAGPIVEIGAGWYATPLSAADTNGAMIALRFSAAGAADTLVTIATQAA